jgi:autotransporter-associated beta strand protein
MTAAGENGLVEVLAGGTLRLPIGITIGSTAQGAGSAGTLRVSGAGSTLEVGGEVSVGRGGSRVEILGGARVTQIGTGGRWSTFSAGGLRLAGAGTDANFGSFLSVNNGDATLANAGLIVENGAILRVGQIDLATPFSGFSDTGSMIVRSGGRIVSNNLLLSASAFRAAALIDGGALEIAESITLGNASNGTLSELIFRNGGSVQTGTLRVLNSGSVLAFGGLLADAPSAMGSYDVANLVVTEGSRIVVNHTGTPLTISSFISGSGLVQHRAGTTIFTGTGSDMVNGRTELSGGVMRINGIYGGPFHVLDVTGGATLGGTGQVRATVNVADGRIAPGNSAGNLTINGNLVLGADSILDFELGAPNLAPGIGSDLITVGGNLTLDGALNITDLGGFGAGLYRLIDYTGALTDNGLALGTLPNGFSDANVSVQTSVAQQVNLMVGAPAPSSFFLWDGANATANGAVDGGSGTWTTTGTNWTVMNGSANGAYDPAALLVFAAPGGSVTIDNGPGQVAIAGGLQFAANGYTLTGGALRLDSGSARTLRIGDGTAAGAGFTTTIASALTGTGGVLKTDLGRLVLTGANTYTGGTTVAQGTLEGSAASLIGAIEIGADGTLVFDQAAAGTFGGTLTGGGLVQKRGAGVLTLSGNSTGLTGRFDVLAGTLDLTGVVGGAGSLLNIASGATLTGNGTAGSLDVSGTLAPSPGTATFNVGGDATFRSGSTFAVELRAAGATDRLVAGGAINLLGGTVAITALDPELDYTDGSIFVIAEAGGGLTGTFAGLTENSAFLDFTLGYDANRAFLTLDVIRMFPDVAQTFNQREASTALMELGRTQGSDALAVYNEILLLDEGAARSAFDFASGEIYADVVAGEQRAALLRGAGLLRRGMQPGRQGWQAWIGAGLERVRVSGDGNGARFTRDGENFELGLEYRGEDDGWAIGVMGGYLAADIDNDDRLSAAMTDGWQIGGYARYGSYGPGLTAGVAVVHADQGGSAERIIRVGTLTRTAASGIDSRTTAVSADLRYGLGSDSIAYGPAVSIDHVSGRLGAFGETGAGALNLSSDGVSDSWTRYGVGAFLAWRTETGRLVLDARYTIDDDDVAADLAMDGSPAGFTVLPARAGEDAVALAATGSFDIGEAITLGVDGQALFAEGSRSVAANLFLRWVF